MDAPCYNPSASSPSCCWSLNIFSKDAPHVRRTAAAVCRRHCRYPPRRCFTYSTVGTIFIPVPSIPKKLGAPELTSVLVINAWCCCPPLLGMMEVRHPPIVLGLRRQSRPPAAHSDARHQKSASGRTALPAAAVTALYRAGLEHDLLQRCLADLDT